VAFELYGPRWGNVRPYPDGPLEAALNGLLENLPESEQREEPSNVEVNNNKLFSEATEVFQYYGWKIENEWDYYIKNNTRERNYPKSRNPDCTRDTSFRSKRQLLPQTTH